MMLTLVGALGFALSPSSAPAHLTAEPAAWHDHGPAGAAAPVTLTFALRHSADARRELERRFWQVSDPEHAAYTRFLGPAELRALVVPRPAALRQLREALAAHGAPDDGAAQRALGDGDFWQASLRADRAERLLGAPFHVYEHAELGVRFVRPARPPALPPHLAAAVDFVGGATHLPTLDAEALREQLAQQTAEQPVATPAAKPAAKLAAPRAARRLAAAALPASPPVPPAQRFVPIANPLPWRGANTTVLVGLRCQDASFPSTLTDCADQFAMRTLHLTVTTHTSYAQSELQLPSTDFYYSCDGSQFWADVKSNKMVRQVPIAPYCRPCSHWKGAAPVDGVDVYSLCAGLVKAQGSRADQAFCLLRFERPEYVGYRVRIEGALYFQYTEPSPNNVPVRCIRGAPSSQCDLIFTPQPAMRAAALRRSLALPATLRGFADRNAMGLVQVGGGGGAQLAAARRDVAAFDAAQRLPASPLLVGAAGVRAPHKPPAAAASAAASAAAPGAPASVGRASASEALETLSMLAPAVATWFWRITPAGGGGGGGGAAAAQQEQEPFLRWLMGLSTRKPGSVSAGGHGGVKKQLPWVQVLLYSEPEALLPRAYTDRVNVELQKVGLRGFSVVVSSGADGAPGSLLRLRRGGGKQACSTFEPEFPATSPYVTAVGTTAQQMIQGGQGRRLGALGGGSAAPLRRLRAASASASSASAPGGAKQPSAPTQSQIMKEYALIDSEAGGKKKTQPRRAPAQRAQAQAQGGGGGETVPSAADLRLEKRLEKEALANSAAHVAEGRSAAGGESAAHVTASSLKAAWRLATVAADSSLGVGISSGGGFSNRYPRARYQLREVDSYLAAHPTLPAALFNESGRAFPDVSMPGLASGLGALRIARSTGAELAGVAAAAPAGFGALVSLLNDIRLQRGQPPLGFLNPALYRLSRHAFGPSHLRSFVDVVSERLRSSRATEQATERRAASHPHVRLSPLSRSLLPCPDPPPAARRRWQARTAARQTPRTAAWAASPPPRAGTPPQGWARRTLRASPRCWPPSRASAWTAGAACATRGGACARTATATTRAGAACRSSPSPRSLSRRWRRWPSPACGCSCRCARS